MDQYGYLGYGVEPSSNFLVEIGKLENQTLIFFVVNVVNVVNQVVIVLTNLNQLLSTAKLQ